MFVNCYHCSVRFNEDFRWTICPHALRPRSYRPLLPEPAEPDPAQLIAAVANDRLSDFDSVVNVVYVGRTP